MVLQIGSSILFVNISPDPRTNETFLLYGFEEAAQILMMSSILVSFR